MAPVLDRERRKQILKRIEKLVNRSTARALRTGRLMTANEFKVEEMMSNLERLVKQHMMEAHLDLELLLQRRERRLRAEQLARAGGAGGAEAGAPAGPFDAQGRLAGLRIQEMIFTRMGQGVPLLSPRAGGGGVHDSMFDTMQRSLEQVPSSRMQQGALEPTPSGSGLTPSGPHASDSDSDSLFDDSEVD